MNSTGPHRIKTIAEFHQLRGLPKPKHPLISVVQFDVFQKRQGKGTDHLLFDFYAISLKRGMNHTYKYGQQTYQYDFNDGVMFFMAGLPWLWIIALGGAGVGGVFAAYSVFPHVALRIDKFLTGEGDTFQVDMGREALINGGWFGVGPGEGTVKRVLPDAHTDFVYSVAGEEFGLILLTFLTLLFAVITVKGVMDASRHQDIYRRAAGVGLYAIFGQLRATANWRRFSEELWPIVGGPPSTELGRQAAEWAAARGR